MSSKGVKSQPLSSRTCPIAEKSTARKNDSKFSLESIRREKRISTPLKVGLKKKSPSSKSPKTTKETKETKPARMRSSSSSQKTSASSVNKYVEKKKRKVSSRTSKIKSEPVSLERDRERGNVCHCEFYKKSQNNYCQIHGMPRAIINNNNNNNTTSSNSNNSSNVAGTSKNISKTARIKSPRVSSPENAKRRPKTCDEATRKVTRSDEASLGIDDT